MNLTAKLIPLRWLLLIHLLHNFAQTTLAAYVQFQDCYDSLSGDDAATNPARLNLEGLRASLDISAPRLEMNLTGSYIDNKICETIPSNAVWANATVSSVGRITPYNAEVETTCRQYEKPGYNRALIRHHIAYDLTRPAFLDTFEISLHLTDNSSIPLACAKAHITPALSPILHNIALFLPISSFLLTLILAIWQEIIPLPFQAREQGPFISTPSPAHLTVVSQALSYTQFIFFSSSLSLLYPGFLRAVASSSSWSTLMIPGAPILSATPYYGISDGIYEVNGTFGGTPGLELMTQVVGAPITVRTWANIIMLSLMLLIGMVLLFQLFHRLSFTRAWISSNSARFRGTTDFGMRGTAWTILRIFLSYFLTPITAWTTYQLTGATLFPIYHTVITSLVVALLIAALWWGVTQNSPRNMGYLILDSSKRLQTPGNISKSQDRHAMATFALMFVQGAAIGALQITGLVQLLVLMACEIVQLLVMGFTWKCFPLFRRGGLLTGAKLGILGLCIGFLPDISGYKIKIFLGLVVLGVHGIVLLGFFILPGLLRVGIMMTHTFYRARSGITNEAGLEAYNLQPFHSPDTQLRNSTWVSIEAANSLRGPSSLLVSSGSTVPLRNDAPEHRTSQATARRPRLSLSSSSSGGSTGESMRSKEVAEEDDSDEDDIEELGSPSNVYEATVGRRFSRASVLNYSRPLHERLESP